jgi:hypothetical protein
MKLETFASQVLNTNIPKQPQKSQVMNLLPPQQRTRSYGDLEKVKPKVEPTMVQYSIGEHQGEWLLRYNLQFPFGTDRKQITKKDIEDFAEEYLLRHSYRGDDKYISIVKADLNQIWYQFDVVKWMNDNFKGVNPRFKPPMTLIFPYRNSIPSMVFIRAVSTDLKNFVEKRFEEWMKPNTRKLIHKSFDFLRKIKPEFFEYELDTQSSYMRAALKYSVVIGALALYTAHKHDKDFSKRELNSIKSRVSRLGDVKKLDRYIKKL